MHFPNTWVDEFGAVFFFFFFAPQSVLIFAFVSWKVDVFHSTDPSQWQQKLFSSS